MLKLPILLLCSLYSFAVLGEELKIQESTVTIDGITKIYVLTIDTSQIDILRSYDPTLDEAPLSVKDAIQIARDQYYSTYGYKDWGVARVLLQRVPHPNYRDRWFYNIDLVGEPDVSIAVFFNRKAFSPKELRAAE